MLGLHAFKCTVCTPGTRESQRRHQIPGSGVRVLSHHMAPRNWTRVPAKAAAALSLQPSVHYSSIERVFLRFIFMSIGWLCPHDMSVHHMHAWYPCKTEEGSGFPKTEISDSDELPCGLWELNLGPLQEQPMALTDISPAPNLYILKCHVFWLPLVLCLGFLMLQWVCILMPAPSSMGSLSLLLRSPVRFSPLLSCLLSIMALPRLQSGPCFPPSTWLLKPLIHSKGPCHT